MDACFFYPLASFNFGLLTAEGFYSQETFTFQCFDVLERFYKVRVPAKARVCIRRDTKK